MNLLIFGLGFFIDFFEIAFILLPLLAPVADKLGIDLIWFGIIVAMNLQTSFLTPPFGFALFYLRSVAPSEDYKDRVTRKPIRKITTAEIYKGSVHFVIMQLIMLAVVISFPALVLDRLDKKSDVDTGSVSFEVKSEDDKGTESNDKDKASDNPFAIKEE